MSELAPAPRFPITLPACLVSVGPRDLSVHLFPPLFVSPLLLLIEWQPSDQTDQKKSCFVESSYY